MAKTVYRRAPRIYYGRNRPRWIPTVVFVVPPTDGVPVCDPELLELTVFGEAVMTALPGLMEELPLPAEVMVSTTAGTLLELTSVGTAEEVCS